MNFKEAILCLALLCVAALAPRAKAQSSSAATDSINSRYAIVPRPNRITPRNGGFALGPGTTVFASPGFTKVARRFSLDIANATGFELKVAAASGTGVRGIHLTRRADLAAEAYVLDVTPARVVISASTPAGAFYGLETLKQLLPADIYRQAPLPDAKWTVPAVRIEDAPRFEWRGAHLDVSRHFMSKEFVRKYIDLLARHKFNRFHWHLTDDQGWRIQINKYPRLTEVASCRDSTLVGRYVRDPAKRVYDGKPHCGFYTQDDVREIVAYAAERMITVVPEIEMPGHAQAVITAYPFLSSRPDTTVGVLKSWGISPFILNPSDSAVSFMQDVLVEVLALFPSKFIHVGGDEAPKDQWKANPDIQARIRLLGLKDEHEMQSWFIRQMDAFLNSKGRRLIGWDEILEGGLAENATVMSWRGMQGGIAAAKAGHDVVMAPVSHTYFDYYQSRDQKNEPLAIGGFIPLDTVYAFEPIPPELSEEEARHVLGAQAQVWTEYILTPKHVEYMAYPRLTALSEVVWSRKDQRDFVNFLQRLSVHLKRLDALDVNYRKP